MSTVAAPEQTNVEQSKVEAIPPSADEQKAILTSIFKPKVDVLPPIQKPPVAKVEPVKEEKKEEVKEVKKEEKPLTDAEKNFAALRQKAEEAEKRFAERDAEAKRIHEEFETYKKQPVPKEFEEKLTAAEKRAQEYQQELRSAALARDPDFQRKYDVPIKSSLERMAAEAIAGGADPKEVNSAIAQWDENKFALWLDEMPPANKLRFQTAYGKATELDNQRSDELKNSEQAWTERQKHFETEQKRAHETYLESLKGDKKEVLSDLMNTQDIFKNDETLRKETEALLDRAAGLNGEKLSNRQVLDMVAKSHVLARHFQRVDKERADLAAELEATKKTLAERDAFIKEQAGAVPGISGSLSAGAPDTKSIVSSLLNPRVG